MPKSQRIRNVKSYLKRLFQRMHEQFTNDDQGQSLIILGPKWSYCMEFLVIYKESCTHMADWLKSSLFSFPRL